MRHALRSCVVATVASLGYFGIVPAALATDASPPSLSSLTLDGPSAVTPGDTVTISSDAADDVGVVSGQIAFAGPAGRNVYGTFDPATGKYTANITADEVNGSYPLYYASLFDAAGNFINCWGPGNGSYCFTSAPGSGTTPFDGTPVTLTVSGSSADGSPPSLSRR